MALFIFTSLITIYYKNTKDIKTSVFFAITMFYLSKIFWVARAQEISFFLFIWEFYFIEKLAEKGKKKYGIILIIIGILLANFHSSVYPVYFVMYLPYIASFVMEKLNIKVFKTEIVKISNVKLFFIIFLISLFTGLCTTTGLAPYTDMINVVRGVSNEYIGELSASTWYNNRSTFIVFAIAALSYVFSKEKVKITDIFYIVGFFGMAINTFRCSGFFWLISGISINRILSNYIKDSLVFSNKYVKTSIFIVLSFVYILLASDSIIKNLPKEYVEKNIYPVEVSNYILNNLDIDKIKIYNHMNYGSYLEFRGIKPFLDSRTGMFTTEFNPGITVLEDEIKLNDDSSKYKEIFEKYDITYAVISKNGKLFDLLKKDWNTIFEDENFTLFEKK